MSLWSKLTGQQTTTATPGRTTADRRRISAEIRRIDAGTSSWLRRGGIGPRKDR
jgi:hypothetical protein